MKELVSICIPTYNGAEYLEQALESVIQQTYTNIEVVVSDDNSTDKTLEIVEAFKDSVDFPVKVYKHAPAGIGANWNNCIKKASGKYIKFLFQDDILLPDCLREMVLVLESSTKTEFVSSKRNIIIEDFDTEDIKPWLKIYGDLQVNLSFPEKDNIMFLNKSIFKHPSFLCSPLNKVGEPTCTMFARDLIQKVGYFRKDLYQILDNEFYYRVLKKTNIAVINKKLVSFRLHSQQETSKNVANSQQDIEAFDFILLKNYFFYLSWEEQRKLLRRTFRNFLQKLN